MRVSASTKGTVDRIRPKQGLNDLKQAGFQSVLWDISSLTPGKELKRYEKKFREEEFTNQLLRGEEELRNLSLPVVAVRTPKLDLDTARTDLWGKMKELTKQSIAVSERLHVKNILVQPIFSGVEREELWETNSAYFLELLECTEQEDTVLLLENQCRNQNGHLIRGLWSDPVEALDWIERLNSLAGAERFGFCMNVGSYSICGMNVTEIPVILKKYLKLVIISDGDGQEEGAMLPYTVLSKEQSPTDYLGLIRGLRSIHYDGELVLDFSGTAMVCPPLLRPQMLAFAKATSDYLLWQIGMEQGLKKYQRFVLFGAGNMCRNFMKCYGEQYPPLFTCDNNPATWGTEFCGLEVKNPEELRNLPKDTVVVICNIYYREIEAQLRELGVENMERFNDEYLPSFYFDRMDRINRNKKEEL